MTFQVRLDEQAALSLRHAPPDVRRRLRDGLRRLQQRPVPVGTRSAIRRLHREEHQRGLYRLRVGDWRIVYGVEDRRVDILRILHRSEGYGWLADMD